VEWSINGLPPRLLSRRSPRWPDGVYDADVYFDADPAGNT
jgi:hypothetical protein